MVYYETTRSDGNTYPLTMAHNTLEEAITYADENGIDFIYQIGANWEEYQRCSFCGEFWDPCEIDANGYCFRCLEAIRSHGG